MMCQRQEENNLSILACWNNIWNSNTCGNEYTEKANSGDSLKDDFFQRKYKEIYHIIELKANKNKERNFTWKKRFVYLLAVYGGALLATGIFIFVSKANLSSVLFPVIVCALGGFGILLAVLKWLDVSRFQETWARHRWVKELLDLEMIRFVGEIPPYSDSISEDERKMEFQKRVLEILQKNIEKFASNLESKEPRLGDDLSFPDLGAFKEKL